MKCQRARAESEWVRLERPDLRIVPEPLWQAVEQRLKASREAYLRATNGQLWGRPASGVESRYLLTGLAQCRECGGSLVVHSRPSGRRRVGVYVCSYHYLRGRTVCPNRMVLPMDATNRAVLATIEREILHPAVVGTLIRRLVDELQPQQDTVVPRQTALRAEPGVIEQELARLTTALAQGGEPLARLDAITAREQGRRRLPEELAGLEGLRQASALDLRQLERQVEGRLADSRGLLTRHVTRARQILKKLVVGRIVFRPVGDGAYEFTGQATVGRLLSGLVRPKAVVSPTGFEPVFPD